MVPARLLESPILLCQKKISTLSREGSITGTFPKDSVILVGDERREDSFKLADFGVREPLSEALEIPFTSRGAVVAYRVVGRLFGIVPLETEIQVVPV